MDWRWHKNIHGSETYHNQRAVEQYERNIHNLLDYRYVKEAITEEESFLIREYCNNIFEVTKKFRLNRQRFYLEEIRGDLEGLAKKVCNYSRDTANALNDFIRGIDAFLADKPVPRLEKFFPFFGRGTQYLSFIRKNSTLQYFHS